MTAHYDVVGVKNENDWSYKPFSGFYDNEYIYSRGTIDDKGSVFAILEALNELIISGFVPQNDLYIAFSHCEETGSIEGAPKVIEYFKKNNIKFNTALDEGGRIAKKNSNYFAFVGTKEKGRLLTKITVYGKGSHASTPYQNSAVKKLAKLIFAFEKNQENARILPEIKKYYKTTYKSYSTIDKFLISNMDILKPLFIYKMSKNNEENARLASTAAITIIEASNVQNAVSNEASMLVDIRILPDKSTDDIKKYVNKIIKQTLLDKDIKVEYLSIMEPCVSKNANDDEFQKLAQIIRKIYPNIPVSPYLTLGATDAREYSEISDNTYRFLPCILKPEEYALMHSDNEKISIKNWGRMIDFYKEYILNK
ncbi:M20/M25/M40 family metallo-hydrolase, partial [bacterium]|nr:M20/M25/M40 family metallo-hydrolase [bacterium]